MTRSSSGGIDGTIWLGGTTSSRTCLYAVLTGESPANGGWPVAIS